MQYTYKIGKPGGKTKFTAKCNRKTNKLSDSYSSYIEENEGQATGLLALSVDDTSLRATRQRNRSN